MNRDQTLELHSRGKEAWNAWALSLLQRRKQLERAELWAEAMDTGEVMIGLNALTSTWLDDAQADFSSITQPTLSNLS